MTASSSLISDLPRDWRSATLVGRLQSKDGPIPVVVVGGRVAMFRAMPPLSRIC